MTERRRLPWLRFAAVAAVVALDLWSKQAVFAWLPPPPPPDLVRDAHGHARLPLLGEWLALMTSENPGAAFGRFGGWPRTLVLGRIGAVLFLLVALWRAKRAHPLLLVGIVLVLAGAVGNLYDNLFREAPEGRPFGLVRDFIDVYFRVWDWHFPTFNVADASITVGAVAFLLHGFLARDGDQAGAGDQVAA
jgi:lipoprotein signal peptidase